MSKVVIYTDQFCPFCWRAKNLLVSKGVAFDEVDIGSSPEKRQEMTERAGGAFTVPQIFAGQRHIGGSDDLMAAEKSGELDKWLEETR